LTENKPAKNSLKKTPFKDVFFYGQLFLGSITALPSETLEVCNPVLPARGVFSSYIPNLVKEGLYVY